MPMSMSVRAFVVLSSLALASGPSPAHAQYAETPRTLAAVDGGISAAAQIGHRLFVSGNFRHVSPPLGGAVTSQPDGTLVPGGLPLIDGTVHHIVGDGHGGWVVAGGFRHVAGQPFANFARIGPDRAVDPRYRINVDGPIRRVSIAHGRVYLIGDFTEVNGARRLGLAALDTLTGRLAPWGRDFDPGIDALTGERRVLRNLAVSSTSVYVSGGGSAEHLPDSASPGRLWGLDAGSGTRLFERAAFVTAIAPTSARVYVGGYRQPALWAVHPRTGGDMPWLPGVTFQNDGSQEIRVTALLLDGTRLYAGGFFRTLDNQFHLVAVEAASGAPSAWRASDHPGYAGGIVDLVRAGAGLIAIQIGSISAWDVGTGDRLPWRPYAGGLTRTVAPAPEGAALGGNFIAIGGSARSGLASFDLETGSLESWSVTLPDPSPVDILETDGASLFAATSGTFFKIDPGSGAVLGSIALGGNWVTERLAGGRIVVVADHATLIAITTSDWSVQPIPLTLEAGSRVHAVEVVGDTVYLAGRFDLVSGVSRPFLAAIDAATGVVLPFDASPDAEVEAVRFASGRLWVSGRFRRIGGERRRGLAELDPVTGHALAWNPDAPGGASLEATADGTLFVAPANTLGGRSRGRLAAFSIDAGGWQGWRPSLGDYRFFLEELADTSFFGVVGPLSRRAAFLADCLVPTGNHQPYPPVACYPRALPSPSRATVEQAGALVGLSWSLPDGPRTWTGVRVDVGAGEGSDTLASYPLPAEATSLAGTVPPGAYFARVRTTGPGTISLPTSDVSFAVGPPPVPGAPLEPTASTDGTTVTVTWRAPSVGAPPGYLLEAEPWGEATGVAIPLDGDATSVTIEAPQGRYWGRLKAVNAAGSSAPSAELAIDVDASDSPCYGAPPLPPVGLAAGLVGGEVVLTWLQPGTGPVPNLQRLVVGSAPGLDDLGAIDLAGAATSYRTTAPAGTYYVRAIAVNSCGASTPSNEVRVSVP